MRVSKNSFRMDCQLETSSWRVEYKQDSFVFKGGDGITVVVEGEVYYYIDRNDKPIRFTPGNDTCGLLKRVYDSVGQDGFSESVEGMYNVAVIDEQKDTISIFGDAFNRVNLFYCLDRKHLIISTELRDVLSCFDNIEYEPGVFYCLLILGYPPAKHTPYRGLRRLSIGERLLLQNNDMHLVKAEVKPLVSMEMGEAELDRYGDIIENAILSRSSESENWVELSGWDSTVILGVLRKHFDASKVRAVTLGTKYSDGSWLLVIKEAIEIGRHYGVPVEFVELSLADARLPEFWNDAIQAGRPHLVYDSPLGYQAMANLIKEKGEADAAVFIGSFADALHDFAFSHYGSLPYLSRDFHYYAGKIMAYLYSPAFLKKVIDGSFEDDFAYKLFKWQNPMVEFTDVSFMSKNERVFEYLLSFILSSSRLPFAPIATESVFLNDAKVRFKDWLYENYFKDAVEQIDCRNMYFWLIWLYQHFHLQGFEKSVQCACFQGSGKQVCQPYYDLRFVKFCQTMPENWGRGLEWRPGKYPLKHYGVQKLGVPYEILESLYHAPMATGNDQAADRANSETINDSALTSSVWKEVRGNANPGRLFDKEWFNIDALDDMLQTGQSESGARLPRRLLMLLSFGFEER